MQRTAMNVDHDRPHLIVVEVIDVGFDLDVADLFVRDRRLHERLVGRAGSTQLRADERTEPDQDDCHLASSKTDTARRTHWTVAQ